MNTVDTRATVQESGGSTALLMDMNLPCRGLAAGCLLLAVLPDAGPTTLESSLGTDAANRIHSAVLFRTDAWEWGGVLRSDEGGAVDSMGGFNTAVLSLGHLDDAGLAAEIRNPDAGALARLGETTRYRADLRTLSRSRYGISASGPGGRCGVTWERRNGLDAGVLWAASPQDSAVGGDAIATAVLVPRQDVGEDWYPSESGRPESVLILGAGRLDIRMNRLILGGTLLASGGPGLLTGLLTSGSFSFARSAVRLRGRIVGATARVRTADAEAVAGPLDAAVDFRWRPARGPNASASYRGTVLVSGNFVAEGNTSFGWDFGPAAVAVDACWNPTEAPRLRRMSLQGEISSPGGLAVELRGRWESTDHPSGSLVLRYRTRTRITLKLTTDWTVRPDGPLFGIGGRVTWPWGANRLILTWNIDDIPRDWTPAPGDAGDGEITVRWIRRLGD